MQMFSKSEMFKYLIKKYGISLIISILGCVCQLYYICSMYFTFPTIVSVDISSDPKFEIPGVTICGYINMTDRSVLSSVNKDIDYSNYSDDQIGVALNELNISDLFKYAKIIGDIKFVCYYMCYNEIENYHCQHFSTPCEKITNITETIQWLNYRELVKCYTYFENNYHQPKAAKRDWVKSMKHVYWFNIFSNTEVESSFKLILHPGRNLYYADELFSFRFHSGELEGIRIGYRDTRYILMPKPYVTDCNNYDEYPKGRYGCISECRKKWYYEK